MCCLWIDGGRARYVTPSLSCCREQLRPGMSEPCTSASTGPQPSSPLLQTALSGRWLGCLCPKGGPSSTSFAFTSTTISKQGDRVSTHTHTHRLITSIDINAFPAPQSNLQSSIGQLLTTDFNSRFSPTDAALNYSERYDALRFWPEKTSSKIELSE